MFTINRYGQRFVLFAKPDAVSINGMLSLYP
jgi:hypothetical protein